MRFPSAFKRVKPAATGEITLGADVAPNAALGAPSPPPGPTITNALFCKSIGTSAQPCARLAVAYNYQGAGVALALPADVWFWDGTTQRYYRIQTGKTLTVDTITHFEVPALAPPGDIDKATSGNIDAILVVSDPGAAPNGTYVFGWGPDLAFT